MSLRCTAVRADAALPALAAAVRAAKGDAPLAHLTVIVPTNAVGVTARRWLGANGGVAAIELVTPARLAERMVGAEFAAAGRLPVSTPLIDLMVRQVLTQAPGDFAPVASHPSTVTSLRDLHRELRMAGPLSVNALRSASRRGFEAGRVSDMVTERLAEGWFDEADLLTRAVEHIDRGGPPFERAVVFLPRPERGLAADLLAALGRHVDLDVLVEWSGVQAVDAETVAFAERLGATVTPPSDDDVPPPTGEITVVSTTDADEEVRHAVRRLVDAARDGVPFARMALVWPVDRPYARLAEHHLAGAGIEWNGRPGTLVTERLVPRFLLDLLRLDRRGLRRRDVFDFLADLPIRGQDGERVSVARWERVARMAGVSRDEHWAPRLGALAAALRNRPTPRERDADAADELADFVTALRRDLGPTRRTQTWNEWADWCGQQVLRRLGRSILDQLDEAERLASDHTNKVLDRLRALDQVSGPVDRTRFRAAFEAEFEIAPGRLGRLGTGVTIGSLAGTAGLDADLTIVLGAADGLLPPPPTIDPLVSQTDRVAAGLAGTDARVRRLHRSLIGHLATSRQTVLSVPRGDLRATTERLPSRWIAVHAPDADRHDVPSHHRGMLDTPFPAAAAEHRLRARLAVAAGRNADAALAGACADDAAAARGLAMRAARRSDRVTEYDGDLTGIDIDHFERPVSASRIESWPGCPHAYFMRYLLGVYPLDDPADELSLTPIERGNVLHETLDRFHRRVLAGDLEQPGPDGWSTEHQQALLALYDEVADEFERTGRTGRPANWWLERRTVRNDLIGWSLHDSAVVAARAAQVLSSEGGFGYGDDDQVSLPLPDGRRVAVAGFIDRIDRRADGGLVVTDHKTGSTRNFVALTADDPTVGGTKFQLPIYAAAALRSIGEVAGESDVPVDAEYSFFATGDYRRIGYRFDAEIWAHVTDDLGEVVAGIESGLYPAVTEPPKYEFIIGCHYCQPDGLGVDERYAEWARKQHDPRLARWFADDETGGDDDGDA